MSRAVLLLSLLLLLVACQPPDNAASAVGRIPAGYGGRIELPAAPTIGPAVIIVHLHDETGPVTGAVVTVTGDMTHAGMVPVISETAERAPGAYETTGFSFNMGGDWFLLAAVELADGSSFELSPHSTSVSSN